MELTREQQQAAETGGIVRFVDPATQIEYVLLRADVYDRVASLVYDDSPWTDEEMIAMAWEAGKSIGWDTPEMAEYDDYEEHRKQP